MSAELSACQTLQQLLLSELSTIRHWRKVAIKGTDPEGVHQLRVSLRKMRSALTVFRPVLKASYRKYWRRKLKSLARQLDNARDLDVFLLTQFQPEQADTPLHSILISKKRIIDKQLSRQLKSGQFNQYRRRLKRELKHPHWQKKHCRHHTMSLSALASQELNLLYQHVQQRQALQLSDETALHQLRIACKALRYGCEFLKPVLDSHKQQKFVEKLKALQDQLGDIHDAAVQQNLFPDLPATAENELLNIINRSRYNIQQLKKTLKQQLDEFNALPIPWTPFETSSKPKDLSASAIPYPQYE